MNKYENSLFNQRKDDNLRQKVGENLLKTTAKA